jgi:MFS family permease
MAVVHPELSDVRADFQARVRRHLRFNFAVNVIDGSFFGFGLGLTSSITVMPLFVSQFTDSTTLIGLISSIHWIGWHLPQLLTVRAVARQSHYKPMTLRMTLQERWPFLALAGVAFIAPSLPAWLTLALIFILFGWHSLGAGITATAWQSMIGRIMPPQMHGKFFGTQSAGFSLLSMLGAFIAGSLLANVAYPVNFALCFLLASVMMVISFVFLAATREPDAPPPTPRPEALAANADEPHFWPRLWAIFNRDAAFRRFLLARVLAQFAIIGMSFYTIYSVRRFELEPDVIGLMTSLLLFAQAFAHPLVGAIGDRLTHRWSFVIGGALMALANLIAISATQPGWMVAVFMLAGAGNAAFTTAILATNLTFGAVEERPYYIGLGNTLIAPFTLLAPIIGGALVDGVSFPAMFIMAIAAALGTLALVTLSGQRRRAA